MRALRSFTVRPRLPEALAPLERLAMNLRWSWDERTRDLFRWVDPGVWDETDHDPVRLLGLVSRERLDALARDANFVRFLQEVSAELDRYLASPRWFQVREGGSPLRLVGYFSPEFGISEALPQYSGGLGVLAGDHLKACSDLGVPLVGVGLFYRHGYFRQRLAADGWQQEQFPNLDPHAMALSLCDGVRVHLDLAGRPMTAQVWRADVGRVPLYLLDADIDENEPELRQVTDRLYGGDTEHRLRQEILLGMGGVRALEALGHDVQVFHTNEGHAGFLGLERIRRLVVDQGLAFDEAIEAVRAGCLFTTHTPVPAGIDKFPRPLMERYFAGLAAECGVSFDQLMQVGQRAEDQAEDRFNMAVMGLRLAGRSNGVAELHGEVSRHMFASLWPDLPEAEVPITSVTNGVHAPTWVASEVEALLTRHVLPDWDQAGADDWARFLQAGDDEVWRVREQARERLVAFVRRHLHEARATGAGGVGGDGRWIDEVLDPKALTIGFARRFATYKRGNLLLAQADRLKALLLSSDRPVQFIYAGKAHPADGPGKEMIRQIAQFAAQEDIRHRFLFLPDYDISVARAMYQGCDVWLNTPRRPQEACGTSGMKAALNGGLNCSILDGWWDEMYEPDTGWAITSFEGDAELAERDRLEADSLFDLLESSIVPLFYERVEGRVPRRWVAKVKTDLAILGPKVTAARMVRDYTEQLYEPTAARADHFRGSGWAPAKELASWKHRVLEAWPQVRIGSVTADGGVADLGSVREVQAEVSLGSLTSADVRVELLHGLVGQGDELGSPQVTPMAPAGGQDGTARYEGRFDADAVGRYGFTVRVVPSHPDLAVAAELGRVVWAS